MKNLNFRNFSIFFDTFKSIYQQKMIFFKIQKTLKTHYKNIKMYFDTKNYFSPQGMYFSKGFLAPPSQPLLYPSSGHGGHGGPVLQCFGQQIPKIQQGI